MPVHQAICPSITLFFWYGLLGGGGHTDPIRKKYHVANIESKLRKLDSNDPATARVVALSAYPIRQRRTVGSQVDPLDSARQTLQSAKKQAVQEDEKPAIEEDEDPAIENDKKPSREENEKAAI